MNFWIDGDPQGLAQVMKRIDILMVNDSEAQAISKETNLICAGEKLLRKGPSIVVIKKGEHGALLLTDEGLFSIPSFPTTAVSDPTGAGDSFAGGFFGYLATCRKLSSQNLRRAMAVGTVMASFCVEKFGVGGLLNLSAEKINHRYRQLHNSTDFDGRLPDILTP